MIRHVFKLVWNRKRATGLILVEILICFLVLCAVLSSSANLASRWFQPLGFDYHELWTVEAAGMNWRAEGEEHRANLASMAHLLQTIKSLPEVESAALTTNLPYSNSSWVHSSYIDGETVQVYWTLATPELMQVLGLELLDGRWIESTDTALGYQAVVITHNLARGLYGDESPVGKDLPKFDEEGNIEEAGEGEKINRIVGVAEDFKRDGELKDIPYNAFLVPDLVDGDQYPKEFLVRVRTGTTAEFEEKLVRSMQSIVPGWTYDTRPIEQSRQNKLMEYIGPVLISAIVAGFLVVMVGLGLVGVLWLSVNRRASEMGLRRALGASGGTVRVQILGELWALTTLAVTVGAIVFLQFPLFGANFGLGWPVLLTGLALAALVTYGFVTLCGLYPTWLATRVQPSEALQYE
jgi:putative ABC transport system permease protein